MFKFGKIIYLLLFLGTALNLTAQNAGHQYEQAAQRANTTREKIDLWLQAADKYMSAGKNDDAQRVAHFAYLEARNIGDYAIAARAGYKTGIAYEKQADYTKARISYGRGKETALQANDIDYAIKNLEKMVDMSRRQGNSADVQVYQKEIETLKKRKASGQKANDPSGTITGTSPLGNGQTPSNPAEMNALREQYRQQIKQLEDDRLRLISENRLHSQERDQINSALNLLRLKEQSLVTQTAEAKQTIQQQSQLLNSLSLEKDELDRVNVRKQKLVEALQNAASLDSIAYAQELQYQEYMLQKARNFRNVLLLVLGFALVIVALIYSRYRDNQKQKKTLEDKNKIIEMERERSDELLLNILPAAIADELKGDGKAQARRYERTNVMFIDFKSFTKISEQLTPEQLVSELDTYFKAFDFIIGQYNLEKIKTIGDCYMVASGLSDRTSTPLSIVRAALEIQEFLNDMRADKSKTNEPYFEARIGIHSGPVVAGVVGVKKFAYDIWGDTVNIAARMQEACEPGYINVSEATYNDIRYNFDCRTRGLLPIKNKADVEMYYVIKEKK